MLYLGQRWWRPARLCFPFLPFPGGHSSSRTRDSCRSLNTNTEQGPSTRLLTPREAIGPPHPRSPVSAACRAQPAFLGLARSSAGPHGLHLLFIYFFSAGDSNVFFEGSQTFCRFLRVRASQETHSAKPHARPCLGMWRGRTSHCPGRRGASSWSRQTRHLATLWKDHRNLAQRDRALQASWSPY